MLNHVLSFVVIIFCSCSTFGQIQLLNDEFDRSESIVNWTNIRDAEGWGFDQLEYYNVNDSLAGNFRIMPYTVSWFEEYRGPHIYKEVVGDFVFTTRVTANNRSLDGVPSRNFSLSGIMLRAPTQYPEGVVEETIPWVNGLLNYVFLSIGRAQDNYFNCNTNPNCSAPHFEVKNTVNSVSNLEVTDIDTATTEMRVARIDSAVIVLYKLAGVENDWIVHRRYARADFPDTMYVGFTTYTDWPNVTSVGHLVHNYMSLSDPMNNSPDLIADFDFARFDSVTVPGMLSGTDLVNVATPEQILSFLGYESEGFCPPHFIVSSDITSDQVVDIMADTLTVISSVSDSASLFISGTNEIELNPGFEILGGSQMIAEIGGCNE